MKLVGNYNSGVTYSVGDVVLDSDTAAHGNVYAVLKGLDTNFPLE